MSAVKVLTIVQATKEIPPIPTGTWTLQASKLSVKEVTKKDREGNEYETDEFTLSVIPTAPGVNVDPDALAEVDPITGKPVYEGKRLFLRYIASFGGNMRELGNALAAFGYPENTNFYQVAEDNSIRGKSAKGDVYDREYPKNDGTKGVEQKVRNWAGVVKSADYQL